MFTPTHQEKLEQLQQGVSVLSERLHDWARQGIGSLGDAATLKTTLNELAASLVDTQLSRPARILRSLSQIAYTHPNTWHNLLLNAIGELYFFVKTYEKVMEENTPESDAMKLEILIQSGVNIKKTEVLEQKYGTDSTDHWLVLANYQQAEPDNLTSRHVWFLGQKTQRFVLLLDYAYGGMPFVGDWQSGGIYSATFSWFPSTFPQRITVKDTNESPLDNTPIQGLSGFTTFRSLQKTYLEVLCQNPFLSHFPVLLSEMRLNGSTFLIDSEQNTLPIRCKIPLPTTFSILFGVWNGEILEIRGYF